MNSEELNFGKGKLYSALPIPAYKALGKMSEYPAQRVLVGLVSFTGKNQRMAHPSYTTLCQVTGMARSTVSKALTKLVEYGLVKIVKFPKNGHLQNKYYLQDACWDSSRMKGGIKNFTKKAGSCDRCGKFVDRGEFGVGPTWTAHWGCGGEITLFRSQVDPVERKRRRSSSPEPSDQQEND